MTRNDYKAIAAAIKNSLWEDGPYGKQLAPCTGEVVAQAIADVCAADNPCFSRSKFLAACGFVVKFKPMQDGEWVSPVHRGYLMKCCDCGLVHRMNFRIVKRKNGRQDVEFQAFRQERHK